MRVVFVGVDVQVVGVGEAGRGFFGGGGGGVGVEAREVGDGRWGAEGVAVHVCDGAEGARRGFGMGEGGRCEEAVGLERGGGFETAVGTGCARG